MIVSVLNNKGGTGKTTTAVNLATATAIEGKKTLIVDLDPQGNATTGLGFEKATLSSTVYNVLSQSRKAEEVLLNTRIEKHSLLPSNIDQAGAEVEHSSHPGRKTLHRNNIAYWQRNCFRSNHSQPPSLESKDDKIPNAV